MRNASLLKIIALMVIAVALIGVALALTAPKNNASATLFSGATLRSGVDAAQVGSTSALNGKDWGAIIGKLNVKALLNQSNNAAKNLNGSTMKAVQDVLGQGHSDQPAAGNISRDANGSLSQAGQLAQKAFDQANNK